jgi:hypothetical protein
MDLSNTVLFRGLMREQDEMRRKHAESVMAEEMALRRSESVNRQAVEDHKMRIAEAKLHGSAGSQLSDDADPALREAAQLGAQMQQQQLSAAEAARLAQMQRDQLRSATTLGAASIGAEGNIEGRKVSAGARAELDEARRGYDVTKTLESRAYDQEKNKFNQKEAYQRAQVYAEALSGRSAQSNRGTLYQRVLSDKALLEKQRAGIMEKYAGTPGAKYMASYDLNDEDKAAIAALDAQILTADQTIEQIRGEMLGDPMQSQTERGGVRTSGPQGAMGAPPPGQPTAPPAINLENASEDDIMNILRQGLGQ